MSISKLSSYRIMEVNDESSSSSSDFILKFSESESEIDKLESQSLQLVVSNEYHDTNRNKAVERSPSLVSGNNCFERGISSATIDVTEHVLFETENEEDNSSSQRFNCRICEGEKVPCEPLSFNNNNIEVKTLFSNNFDDKKEENCSSEESELELKSFKKIRQTHVQLFSSDDSSSDTESFTDFSHHKVKRHKRRCTTRSQSLNKKKNIQKQILEALRKKRSRAIRSLVPFVDRSCTAPLRSLKSEKQKLLRKMKLFRVNLFPGWK